MQRAALTDFLSALVADLTARAAGDDRLKPFADHLRIAAKTAPPVANVPSAAPASRPAAHRFLSRALENAAGARALLSGLETVAGMLTWYQLFQGDSMDPGLSDGLLAAQIIGPAGPIPGSDLRCGLFLLAPGVHYPNHTHAAAEIYYGLSGTLKLSYGLDAGAFELAPGALSVTAPHRLHSLSTGEDPVLLIYVWRGAVDDPNWIWERTETGAWQRAKWRRRPDGAWTQDTIEPVSDDVLRRATGT